jgi:hypothetical protein
VSVEGPKVGNGAKGGPDESEDGSGETHDGSIYTRWEWRGAVMPAVFLLVVVVVVVTGWYLLRDTGPDPNRLEDVDESGSFNLQGNWLEEPIAYGSHVHAINLTLERGDILDLSYSSNGPPGGIQVRLQHPLNPDDGTGGIGGTTVFSSTSGGNGTVHLFVELEGAYQLYFWHPGTARPPGDGDDPDDHLTAAVSYHLLVARANRP